MWGVRDRSCGQIASEQVLSSLRTGAAAPIEPFANIAAKNPLISRSIYFILTSSSHDVPSRVLAHRDRNDPCWRVADPLRALVRDRLLGRVCREKGLPTYPRLAPGI